MTPKAFISKKSALNRFGKKAEKFPYETFERIPGYEGKPTLYNVQEMSDYASKMRTVGRRKGQQWEWFYYGDQQG